jgi:hypothetical protein
MYMKGHGKELVFHALFEFLGKGVTIWIAWTAVF